MFKSKKLVEIQNKLLQQQAIIEAFINTLSGTDRNRVEWCTVHGRECQSTGLLMWEKDLNHKYTFLNTRHCNDFYHISLADVNQMIGKTDTELVKEFKKRTHLEHSFGDLCTATDQYVLEKRQVSRFWEIGYVGGEVLILDVTKSPLRDSENNIIGTRSWALNQSNKECEIKTLLEIFLKNGQATRIGNSESNDIAAYLIIKKDNPFNRKLPK